MSAYDPKRTWVFSKPLRSRYYALSKLRPSSNPHPRISHIQFFFPFFSVFASQ